MNSFKACREKAGMTQKEVALDLGISIQAVSYWETGERMPSYDYLFRLADLYAVSLDVLLGRSESQEDIVMHNDIHDMFSAHEITIIRSYRTQPQSVKNAICDILHIDHQAMQKAN